MKEGEERERERKKPKGMGEKGRKGRERVQGTKGDRPHNHVKLGAYTWFQVSSVSESLRCGIGKELTVVQDGVASCERVLKVLHKDRKDFDDHVTRVSADIRSYVLQQKQRVADDAAVRIPAFFYEALFTNNDRNTKYNNVK